MLKSNEIAKNLLEGKTCDSCCHCYSDGDEYFRCSYECRDETMTGGTLPEIPNEGTCEHWEELFKMSYASVSNASKMKKLKIKWTKVTELEVPKLTEDAIKEIARAIND